MEARRVHIESMEQRVKDTQGGVDADQALALGAHTVACPLLLLLRCAPSACVPQVPPPPHTHTRFCAFADAGAVHVVYFDDEVMK